MMQPGAKAEKTISYPKPIDFRKSIDGLAALIEGDIKVAVSSFNDAENITEDAEEVVASAKRRGQRKPRPAELLSCVVSHYDLRH